MRRHAEGEVGHVRAGVPSAPFVGKTEAWTELAMKRMLRYAAENGYDKVAWTTGEQQAARYDLSKQLKGVFAEKIRGGGKSGQYDIRGIDHTGNEVLQRVVPERELPEVVGKDLADKIVSEADRYPDGNEYTGLDLRVGGEGMKGYYDQIVPSVASKLGKKFGARVGEAELPEGDRGWRVEGDSFRTNLPTREAAIAHAEAMGQPAEAAVPISGLRTRPGLRVHALDITPEMRRSVTDEGQPLFRVGERGQTAPPLRIEDVQANFKGQKVEATEQGFRVVMPSGRRVLVEHSGAIDFAPEALERGHGKAALAGVEAGRQQVLGAYRRIGPEAVIQVAEQGTLPHEVLHAFMDNVATPKERRLLEQQYRERAKTEGRDWEETAADDYKDYFNKRRAAEASGKTMESSGVFARLWSKVYDFFRNAYRSILPNKEWIQEQLYAGKPWERGGDVAPAGGPKLSVSQAPVAPEVATPPKPTTADKVIEGYKANLIGPGSQVANVAGNVGEQAARAGETMTAAFVDRMVRGERTRFSGESRAELTGLFSKFRPALSKLGSDLKDVFTLAPEKVDPTAPIERRQGAIPGKVGRAVRHSFRMLQAFDDFFGTLGKEAELQKLSYRQASRELRGGSAEAIKARAEQIAASPSEGLLKEAEKAKLSRLFKTDPENPGKLMQTLLDLRREYKVLHVVLPFIETPGNIAKLTLERSPVGFIKAQKAYRVWKAAEHRGADASTLTKLKGEAVDAISRPLFGTAILGTFGALAAAGGMTGGGPTDKKQLALKKATGWQPYSFVVPNGDGTNSYVPFHRFEPVSSLLGFAADIAEAPDQKDASQLFDKALGSFAANWLNKTYFTGLSSAIEAANNPKQALGGYLTNLAGSVVPNVVSKAAAAIDPTQRDTAASSTGFAGIPERMGKAVLADIPGLTQTLPAKRSATGAEVERPGNALSRFLSPVQVTSDKPEADLERQLVELGYTPGQPSRTLPIPGTGGKKVHLTDSEYRVVQESNAEAARMLRPRLGALRRMDPEAQEKAIRAVYDRARDNARMRLMRNSGFRARAREELRAQV